MVSRRVVRMVRMVRMVAWVAPCLRLEACHLVLRCVARLVRLVRGLDGARLVRVGRVRAVEVGVKVGSRWGW